MADELCIRLANHLRIDLLGDLELWRDGRLIPPAAWRPSRKTCQLFKILVTHRHRTVSSDELIEWLWPNLDLESARNSLWLAVSHLRHVLEPAKAGRGASTFVLTEPPGYRFDPTGCSEIDVDSLLDRFRAGQAHQRRDQWTAAIDAYHDAERLYRGDYLALGCYQEALDRARQVLDCDPCRESAWRLVMEAERFDVCFKRR